MSQRRIWSIPGNTQRLDGGAMFGNAPKALWERWIVPDERNRIPLACRALLTREPSGRTTLFETGIGAFFSPKLRDRYGVQEPEHLLIKNLALAGFTHQDIDTVVLSHLHFDHAGGMLSPWQEAQSPTLLFPRARYVVGAEAWARALSPHARDRASFIPELHTLLQASGRLEIVEGTRSSALGDDVVLHISHGHTPGLLLSEIPGDDGPILFASDLIPGAAWMHLPITMGYDRFPELLIEEKQAILSSLVARNGRVFFTHDPNVSIGRVTRDPSGRFGCSEALTLPAGLPA